ncbi:MULTISPECIES: hypothetical protein [unclassified Microbacterium]|uniref:hypothetical protein n=1 Tax=unclassified Microbacterium TaxID=2609290 RepID=UPI002469825B|nr:MULTISPECIES: hypothetical protein [unclassified Microbacterium]MDH5131842.1 hypothetical protein [Microbacterium sp. RD10]MDH5135647.1 hypothetical protein [Microbacterium sp. RD11]MDH5145221.1 hypothetical protein [Microbacterium sp. RD12]MDH5153638.1 hypothetical protein [Microbacterium sp. RD06]MDH5166246.1 hypothetical protein [Microbacterium sp. RD02]
MGAIYPRFSTEDARRAFQDLEDAVAIGREAPLFTSGAHHPRAYFGIGGSGKVSVLELARLREEMHSRLSTVSADQRNHDRKFDLLAGAGLAQWFAEDLRGQAGNPGMWSYLTIAVLPDLAVRRFPLDRGGRLSPDRFLAGRRNVFYRTYLRVVVLGSLLNDPEVELFEDDLVGLIDRNLSSDHRLARFVSEQIASTPKELPRREIVRDGLKAVQFESRVTDLGSLSDDELRAMITTLFGASGRTFI